ncbi:HAD family hydrolase [uncultured Selenomonas sp.]|uniref:HAD hydrolase family protein n=1 Tax=uncultured Selenomonas sp. TaxID=159275 RepID=UPI0025D7A92A|nr:HAD family hydrolase [uncultured Selenomonas sp.]
MKLVATDFDGTFSLYGGDVPQENLDAVRAWQAAGHKFGINTGRGLSLIGLELSKHPELEPDFLILNNGAVIVDRERRILSSLCLPQSLLADVLFFLMRERGDAPMLVVTEEESLSIHGNPAADLGIPGMPETTLEKAVAREDVVQLSMNCETMEGAQEMERRALERFPELVGNINRGYLDLNLAGADKQHGIDRMLKATGWQIAPEDLFVIGDDMNDLPAIEAYHGYTVAAAPKFMHEHAKKVYKSVGAMMMENL